MAMSKELKTLVSKLCDLEGLDRYSEIKCVVKEAYDAELDMGIVDCEIAINGTEYRVVHENVIDHVMREELDSDHYALGGCAAWLISDITGIPIDAVEKIQGANCFEALGIILANNHLEEVQETIVRYDGYGPHFNRWDGEEEQAGPFYIFRQ